MKTHKGITRRRALVGALLLFLVGCCALYSINVYYPLKTFAKQEDAAIPLFDALNEMVANELPLPPSGTTLKRKARVGIDHSMNGHGRFLILHYSISSMANFTEDELVSYYQSHLVSNGWEKLPAISTYIRFKRDTACMEFFVLANEYKIRIWHDYTKQSFSPTPPANWLLDIVDIGKTYIVTCPDE